MSRIAKNPIPLPKGVEVTIDNSEIQVKGAKGVLSTRIAPLVEVHLNEGVLSVKAISDSGEGNCLSGTTRATLANMVKGVTEGFERRLLLTGVGYRSQSKGDVLSLGLGYSHPIEYAVPAGITIETPSATEIVVKGCDKQRVGQVAAEIRGYRPPEPYKGKGVRYSNEDIVRKEAKKK